MATSTAAVAISQDTLTPEPNTTMPAIYTQIQMQETKSGEPMPTENVGNESLERPHCSCGEAMETFATEECTDEKRIRCTQCHFVLDSKQPFPYFYVCTGKDCTKYNLCQKCGKYMGMRGYSPHSSGTPLKDIYNCNRLYYIYSHGILGPYTTDQVIKLYVNRKFKNKIYVQNAGRDKTWTKLTLPESHREGLSEENPKRCEMMQYCETVNEPFKKKYPDIYNGLIVNIFSGKVKKVRIPKNMPKEEQKKAVGYRLLANIGKVLLYFVVIFILAHCFLTCVFVLLYWGTRVCLKETLNIKLDADRSFYHLSLVLGSTGIIITPIATVNLMLKLGDWPEIQSWMIAYIIWGTLTWLTTTIVPYLKERKKVKIVKNLMNGMFFIIGADFGEYGFWTVTGAYADGKNKSQLLLAFSYAFFSLSMLLPAAVAGFISNFILEEKFLLRCGDVSSHDLYFESKDAYCEIISSHSFTSFYSFVGGLTSSLIATWALIRLIGYLVLNAFPVLTIYAKKKKT